MLAFVLIVLALSLFAAYDASITWEERRHSLALKQFEESMTKWFIEHA